MTSEQPQAHPHKTKVERVQSYMGLASTTIGVIGAVGTGFVWLATNVFTGNVDIKTDKPVESVMVKVVDRKGQQATYYSKHISLIPGTYHFEVGVPDKKPTKHFDASVQMWNTTVVPYSVPTNLTAANSPDDTSLTASVPPSAGKKHWWQFWKHKDAEQSQQSVQQ